MTRCSFLIGLLLLCGAATGQTPTTVECSVNVQRCGQACGADVVCRERCNSEFLACRAQVAATPPAPRPPLPAGRPPAMHITPLQPRVEPRWALPAPLSASAAAAALPAAGADGSGPGLPTPPLTRAYTAAELALVQQRLREGSDAIHAHYRRDPAVCATLSVYRPESAVACMEARAANQGAYATALQTHSLTWIKLIGRSFDLDTDELPRSGLERLQALDGLVKNKYASVFLELRPVRNQIQAARRDGARLTPVQSAVNDIDVLRQALLERAQQDREVRTAYVDGRLGGAAPAVFQDDEIELEADRATQQMLGQARAEAGARPGAAGAPTAADAAQAVLGAATDVFPSLMRVTGGRDLEEGGEGARDLRHVQRLVHVALDACRKVAEGWRCEARLWWHYFQRGAIAVSSRMQADNPLRADFAQRRATVQARNGQAQPLLLVAENGRWAAPEVRRVREQERQALAEEALREQARLDQLRREQEVFNQQRDQRQLDDFLRGRR